jgi:hypothetical protein
MEGGFGTVKETAAALGVTPQTVERMRARGFIPVAPGGRWRCIDIERAREALARFKSGERPMTDDFQNPGGSPSASSPAYALGQFSARLDALETWQRGQTPLADVLDGLAKLSEQLAQQRKALGLLAKQNGYAFRVYSDDEGAAFVELVRVAPPKSAATPDDVEDDADDDEDTPASKPSRAASAAPKAVDAKAAKPPTIAVAPNAPRKVRFI